MDRNLTIKLSNAIY